MARMSSNKEAHERQQPRDFDFGFNYSHGIYGALIYIDFSEGKTLLSNMIKVFTLAILNFEPMCKDR
jgi:hypothetical protein